jgi:putative SOS response-associated peptidase YedK
MRFSVLLDAAGCWADDTSSATSSASSLQSENREVMSTRASGKDPKGGRRPINAKCETVRDLPTFRDAYRKRRCIVPVDGSSSGRPSRARGPSSPTPSP